MRATFFRSSLPSPCPFPLPVKRKDGPKLTPTYKTELEHFPTDKTTQSHPHFFFICIEQFYTEGDTESSEQLTLGFTQAGTQSQN